MRPTFPQTLLALYQQGYERIGAGGLEAGAESWKTAIEAASQRQDVLRAAWLQSRLARELTRAKQWPEADAAWERAVQRLEPFGASAAVQLLREWGESLQQRNVWDRAQQCYQRALALDPEQSLEAAWDLAALGTIASRRGDQAVAKELYQKAYAIRERLVPESIDFASILNNLAIVAARAGDFSTAEENFRQALEIRQRLAPASREVMDISSNLGNLALMRGDLQTAEEYLRRAEESYSRLEPNGMTLARVLANLGIVSMYRGDLAIAEERFRRAMAIREKIAPDTLDIAADLNNLGIVADKQGDVAAAEDYHRRALDLRVKISPGSPEIAESLANLAGVERRRNHPEKADEYYRRALQILESSAPDSYQTALVLSHRAEAAVERGDLSLAEQLHGRSLAMLEKLSPGSLPVSDSLESLGFVAFERGDLIKAERLFLRALEIRQRLAPDSSRLGELLNDLGQVHRRAGHRKLAAEHFCRATEAFDRQREKLGGATEGKSAFGGTVAEYYWDCLAALFDIGRPEEAFRALERGRARSFLDLLAERDLRWTAELPPELAQDRKQTDTEYDRTQTALARLSPAHDQAEIDRLLVRLRELRARQEEIAAKVRQASPRTAALQAAQPLDLAAARTALDPGTVLLAWSVGKERTFLFVIQPRGMEPGLKVFPLRLGDRALREEVESFRHLVGHPGSDRAALQARARHLYDLLVRPAAERIARAQRILVSPDGPLHALPFAALMRGDRYLVEWKPIHSVLSATVYAELRRSRPAHSTPENEHLAAFGDPVYPAPESIHDDPEVRESLRRGLTLEPLPATRKEVEAIAALYPQAKTYLGSDATEEKAKALGTDSHLIHFACHGVIDERFPLNSALALTLPDHPAEGQDNGLLQAWEIFESVRLDADLVTLSACDTALGKEMGGEGLVGLTRAFQFAGARSVLASLWGVSDVSTARFMQRFYGYLRSGKTKDEALRAAQIDQIRNQAGSSHPFHWAAFEIFGDWN